MIFFHLTFFFFPRLSHGTPVCCNAAVGSSWRNAWCVVCVYQCSPAAGWCPSGRGAPRSTSCTRRPVASTSAGCPSVESQCCWPGCPRDALSSCTKSRSGLSWYESLSKRRWADVVGGGHGRVALSSFRPLNGLQRHHLSAALPLNGWLHITGISLIKLQRPKPFFFHMGFCTIKK